MGRADHAGPTRRAWVEVDVGAMRRNYARLADALPEGTAILPMLKADGYGLGAVRVARALAPLDPWGFGVATVDEGAELRDAGFKGRLVLFSPCPPVDAAAALGRDLEPAVSDLGGLAAFGKEAAGRGRPLAVHLEVDTGMGRLGLPAGDPGTWIPDLRRLLAEHPLELGSTFTHFHSAETDPEATREQWERFGEVLDALRAAGVDPGLVHASNSAAVFRHPEFSADLVRPGIFLYGGGRLPVEPEPVASVRARILDVREVPPGHPVGYGATWRSEGRSRLAAVGIGYGDGLRRELSNRGHALVGGRRAPIRGSVCMDVTVIDVSAVPDPAAGEAATFLGRDGEASVRLEDVAEICGTIGYEILTGLGGRLPRTVAGPDGANPAFGAPAGGGSPERDGRRDAG